MGQSMRKGTFWIGESNIMLNFDIERSLNVEKMLNFDIECSLKLEKTMLDFYIERSQKVDK